MRIFSNFDTNLSHVLLADAQKKFGPQKVLFVRRNSLYLFVKLALPLLVWLFIVIGVLYLYYVIGTVTGDTAVVVNYITWGAISIVTIVFLGFIIDKLISFYMDYVIITPKLITSYDQTSILKRSTRSVDTNKIKTINIEMRGLLRSLFNFGSVVFLAEGDQINGDIKLNFISDPVHLRDKIQELIEVGENMRTNGEEQQEF